ncbi:MAG: GxxExxY protein [Bacteroidetes bacterium]|nr:GxxExxY protein [Bacteroidota bacterium]
MSENEISYLIRGCIFRVYNTLGPGLFESIYEQALVYELKKIGLTIEHQKAIALDYEQIHMENAFKADIIVENKVIVELKSIETITEKHHMQLLTYLRLTGLKLGLLVNFNSPNILKSIFRKVNSL